MCVDVTAQQPKGFCIQPIATGKEKVESAIAMGWRPEHAASLQRLRSYNDSIAKRIPKWEEEERLAEFVDAFWYSNNVEKDVETLQHT